jgi:hypothetical protein
VSHIYKFAFLSLLVLVSLACGLITGPIDQAKNLASTAEAVASAMPIETLQALPSAMPDVGNYLNPTGAPVSNWNGIPIMSQATAGQEFSKSIYSFKASGITEADVLAFYDDQLKTLGWTQPFSVPAGTNVGFMLFQKESSVLTITITPQDNDIVVILNLQ